MKKRVLLVLFSLLTIFLSSCASNKEHTLVISKLYTASSMANNVIELYNNSDNDLDLKNYSIEIYSSGSSEIALSINLIGAIKANSYHVIAGNKFREDKYLSLIDVLYDGGNLPFKGDNAVVLKYKKQIVDILGVIGGMPLEYSRNLTLIRLVEKNTYKPYK
jgi:predicted extracellular nuclease